jgi:hypothetical protein
VSTRAAAVRATSRDREAEAGAVRPARHERLEDPLALRVENAWPVSDTVKRSIAPVGRRARGRDRDRAAVARVAQRVEQQVVERTAHLLGVERRAVGGCREALAPPVERARHGDGLPLRGSRCASTTCGSHVSRSTRVACGLTGWVSAAGPTVVRRCGRSARG